MSYYHSDLNESGFIILYFFASFFPSNNLHPKYLVKLAVQKTLQISRAGTYRNMHALKDISDPKQNPLKYFQSINFGQMCRTDAHGFL